ncbi:MAG: peptidylprolyl isomerase, partial [Bacteroidia bacterium]|nr:peptidylprolyl isomerase [Bacteroidia bacterium]
MKQMRINELFTGLILLILIGFSSCRDDDGLADSVPERDRAEQQAEDVDSLQSYFQTHYYNSAVFENSINPTIDDLVITKLEDGESVPDGHTLLIDDISTGNTVFLDIDYEYYFLKLNQGGGEDAPRFSDQVRVNFEGRLLDGALFDSSSNSVVFDLTALVPGWGRVLPEFNPAQNFVLNTDGTVTFNNAGVGVMFLPSGLGYFSSGTVDIPPYANLLFAFDLFQIQQNDHDNDGIPSYFEDRDSDLRLSNVDTVDNG